MKNDYPILFRRLTLLRTSLHSGYQALVDKRTYQAVRIKFPKRKIIFNVRAPWEVRNKYPEIYKAEYDRVLPVYTVAETRRQNTIKSIENQLNEAADSTPIDITDTEIVAHRGTSGDYMSQGFGATKYARAAAQRKVDELEAAGVPCRIEEKNESRLKDGVDWREIYVYAKTNGVGLDIVSRRKPMDLVERVRLYWKRGVNPRVDMPFLDHGFEEKNGLDYFGNKV